MIQKNTRHSKPHRGQFVSHGIKLEPHEIMTIEFFLDRGEDIEQILPSNTPHNIRPDFFMRSLAWEVKSPTTNSKTNLTVRFHQASKQSHNIIFDLRRIQNYHHDIIQHLEKLFFESRRTHNLLIITKSAELLEFHKKS